jgi:hypothetical protein
MQSNIVNAAQCSAAVPPSTTALPPDTAPPTVSITKVPKQCTVTDFTLRIKVADRGGIRRTDVFLDGKRVKRSTSTNFTVRIKASDVSSGRHTIKAVTQDLAGNRRVKTVGFEVCGRPAISFTG